MLRQAGLEGALPGRTFKEEASVEDGLPRTRMMFGCAYDEGIGGEVDGVQPGEVVAALPDVLQRLVDRLVDAGVVLSHRRPDSAVVNMHRPGECDRPVVTHHDFLRPSYTLALASEATLYVGLCMRPPHPTRPLAQRTRSPPLTVVVALVVSAHAALSPWPLSQVPRPARSPARFLYVLSPHNCNSRH